MSQILIRLQGKDSTNRPIQILSPKADCHHGRLLSYRGTWISPSLPALTAQQYLLPSLALHPQSSKLLTQVPCLFSQSLHCPTSCDVHIHAGVTSSPAWLSPPHPYEEWSNTDFTTDLDMYTTDPMSAHEPGMWTWPSP